MRNVQDMKQRRLSQNAKCSIYETEALVVNSNKTGKRSVFHKLRLFQHGRCLPLIILSALLRVHTNLQPVSDRKIVSSSVFMAAQLKYWQQLSNNLQF
jgi:hypothetical protein